MKRLLLLLSVAISLSSFAQSRDVLPVYASDKTETMKKLALDVTTDKCAYAAGDVITFTATGAIPSGLRVRYRHLGNVVADEAVNAIEWTWTAPESDFTGYLAELYTSDETTDYIYGTVAIDVSSDWARFPRYGFVATFGGDKTKNRTTKEMAWLNRCHINGVQFQDWHFAHDWPLGGTRDNLDKTYTDIANRTIYTSAIKNYIAAQHGFGMKSIFYNLAFGALDGYADRGVKEEWFLFKDKNRREKDSHDLPDSWKSDIYLLNPGNAEWQKHIADCNDDVYYALGFDGYQIDQLGYRGDRYDYRGNSVDLPAGYASFVNAMKQRHPDKSLVMNAVSEYGQQEIGGTHNVDFFYNEVWGNHDYDNYSTTEARYSNLKTIISNNRNIDASKQTVFAAYMDYLRDNEYFNTAGVVMTDAVMFALGGSHLELGGDHMLCREYFPYSGVKWHDEIEDWMKHYYDFQTAYENLLRGEWEDVSLSTTCSDGTVKVNSWTPQAGQVTALGRRVGDRIVVHLLNFTRSSAMADGLDDDYLLCWHDNKGLRPWPIEFSSLNLRISPAKNISRVWVASPDYNGGAVQEISDFTTTSSSVKMKVPNLQFWTMIVLEPEDASGVESIRCNDEHTTCRYNLLGQPVGDDYRGIIVVDGRKELRK